MAATDSSWQVVHDAALKRLLNHCAANTHHFLLWGDISQKGYWIGKHRRDGMSRLCTSRNNQWSAEDVTNSLCSRAYNLVNLSSLRWGYFDERTKKMKENFFEKNEKMYFWQKPESVILHDGNFDSTKSSLHTCLTLLGRMVFVSIFSFEKN